MKYIYPITIAIAITIMVALLFIRIGPAFALIVGGSAIIAFFVWLLTTYRHPVDGRKILPLYILAVAMQFIHMTEEFVAGFPQQFSALTGANLSPDTFVLVAVLGFGTVYMLAGLGLVRQNPIANYVLWFFLIGPAGLVNTVAHFTFPLLIRHPYFPGLITVLLPTIAGTTLAWRVIKDSRQQRRVANQ
jgi:Protein of unknown function with HXXEE motif